MDYTESYSPVVGCSTVRSMLCLSTKEGHKTRHNGFTNAFALEEFSGFFNITLTPMYGHEKPRDWILVLELNKSIYSFVLALWCWFDKISSENS